MVSGFISRLVILIFGTLYPAYASYKAVRTKNVKEYVKWMMYWIVFALFTCAETFTDLFLGFWFPFYYEIKIITVIYLLSPATKGSSILYRKFVHPVLVKREQEIDEYIAKMKEQGYHTMLNLGSKGVNYATSLIMQTAIKGGGGLVNQLKKSYSLNDLTGEHNLIKTDIVDSSEVCDGSYVEDPRLILRSVAHSPRLSAPSAGQTGLYYPGADLRQLPGGENNRQIPSSEKMDPGHPTGDPYYYGLQQPVGPHLARTASLGPYSRIRTRATTKQGLPKRSSLSEGGSTWSTMEPDESQNQTDKFFNFPLSHSASFPFAFHPLQQFVFPEYQHMFGNLTQNQMFTFINHSQPVNNAGVTIESIGNGDSNSPSILISEEDSNGTKTESENEFLKVENKINSVNEESLSRESETYKKNKESGRENDGTIKNENNENVGHSNETVEVNEKSFNERSGRYNKKPAPTPPNEPKTTDTGAEEEAAEFFTPSSSPKLLRKHGSNSDLPADKGGKEKESENENEKPYGSNLLEVPKKQKSKSKKLHMPKMNFSFWHPKSGKQSSVSETSSVASVEITSMNSENKNDLEYFIPLKEDKVSFSETTEQD